MGPGFMGTCVGQSGSGFLHYPTNLLPTNGVPLSVPKRARLRAISNDTHTLTLMGDGEFRRSKIPASCLECDGFVLACGLSVPSPGYQQVKSQRTG